MISGSKAEVSERPADATNLADLVQRVHEGDPSGMEELYRMFATGVRFYLCRQLGPQDLDDKVHDIFLIIAQSIQRGDLREPDRLMGYVRTIVRRQVAAYIDRAVQFRRNHADMGFGITLSDQQPNPEGRLIEDESNALALRILNSLNKRDREVLVRFYLHEQTPDQICRDMGLTETQFRLIKSRAKARFGELGKRRMAQRKGFQRGGTA
jgi:RNA polymerase sigma-70 factor, ECF subfamily